MTALSDLRRRMMFTCRDANAFLVEYLDDALAPARRARFERHIARCACCGAYLDQYRRTIAAVREGAAVDAEPPQDLVDVTLAYLREHEGRADDDPTG